jgi:type IV pilus assembly protein PilY1
MKCLYKLSQNAAGQRSLHAIIVGFGMALTGAAALAGTVSPAPLFLTSAVKPNIMLMIDNSGSMDSALKPTPTNYDSNTTYPPDTDCSTDATKMPIETKTIRQRTIDVRNDKNLCIQYLGTGAWDTRRNRCSQRTVTIDEVTTTPAVYTANVPTDFLGNISNKNGTKITGKLCFDSSTSYTVNSGIIPSGVTTNAQRANYLNWYYSEKLAQSQIGTRLTVAKTAAVGLVNSLNDKVRMGLSTFGPTVNNNTQGGSLLEVMDDLGPTKKTNLVNRINSLSAISWTPLAESLSGIARYYTTKTGAVGSLTLHPDGTSTTAAASSVFTNNLADDTVWSGRAAVPRGEREGGIAEPTFATPPIQFSCQKSFALMMTDGLPTQDLDISTHLQDYDGDCTGKPVGTCGSNDKKTKYVYDSNNSSDYLDDVAEAIHDIDLRPDLTKKLDKVTNKPTSTNNVTTYTVGFADPTIDPTKTEDVNNNGILDAGEDKNGNGKIDPNPLLKDAAEQGGGKFYYAGSAPQLVASLQNAFNSILKHDASASSVAANATQFQTDAVLFQALFNSGDWSGDIKAYNLTTEDTNRNGKLDSGEDANGNGVLDSGGVGTVRWTAAHLIPNFNTRAIFSYDPSLGTGINFLWANLNSTQKQVLDNVNNAQTTSPILNFIRGDRSNEGNDTGEYRIRTSALGDIVNSDPLFVGSQDFGYSNLPEGKTTYPSHVALKKSNPQMLYVGANDGMLHGFNVTYGSTNEGKEIFAYVPNAAISQDLAALADPNYEHEYFVDGGPIFGDAFYDSAWHTVLIGSMGAGSTRAVADSNGNMANGVGGRSVFALDVTHPSNFGVDNVLWEFSSRQDADLGYTIPQASVVRMANGSWAAIVANGYNSTNGQAILYILDVATGTVIKKITADNSAAGGNGLSTPNPVDLNGDNIIDYIYAGDLKGNLWKFDVTGTNTSLWGVAYSGAAPAAPTPMFVALDGNGVRQPITSKPAITKPQGQGQTTGSMVYFGTGKYFESGDHQNIAQIQTFYGIWDQCDTTSPSCNGVVSGRSDLQQQQITFETTAGATLVGGSTGTRNIRVTTQCEVGYGATLPASPAAACGTALNQRRGWYMDLVAPSGTAKGERVVSMPIVREDTVIFVTMIPFTATCEPGGTGWLMELDINGARFTGAPLDLNKDGVIDNKDLFTLPDGTQVAASGAESTVGIIKTPTILQKTTGGQESKYFSGSDGVKPSDDLERCKGQNCGNTNPGSRRSWRQLR